MSGNEFPVALTHGGATYVFTGKTGTDRVTGEPAAEYEAVDDPGARLWYHLSGRIVAE